MAGHSKWANIKRRKQAVDAVKGKVFTRLIRAIKIAAQQGGGDPNLNAALRNAMDAARCANMSKDVVERAIKAGVGDNDGEHVAELTYEGYGPGGVAIFVECLSDNRNRTVSDVRHAFTKYGGNLGAAGSVAYLFVRRGVIGFPKGSNEDQILEVALEAGADDVRTHESGEIDVLTSPDAFTTVKATLEQRGLHPEYTTVTMEASTQVDVVGDEAETLMKLLDRLEELDDVQQVHSNASFADEFLAKLG